MQTFTLGFGVWLRRLASRSPLVRSTDRVEAAVMTLIVVAGVCAVPIAGAVGTAEYDRLTNSLAAERLTHREVDATVVRDSRTVSEPYETTYLTEIGWNVGSVARTAEITTTRKSAGDRLTIWVDDSGDLVRKGLTDGDAATQAVVGALGVWFAVTGLGVATWMLLRLRLDHLRSQNWDRELDDLADNGGRSNNTT
ncbi:Rv1733c family protein [Mycolicibacterium gilvum]|uniref:Transmembrane protein n=2 Tax=Mycolicibacterium gilvum TaxID=1804 RepID=E6TE63_MYCSR|nr:hypothetical protein [Mycolicibacterium gilvum]ABP47464.1 putative conserved transmembrane protein [Mycolicibacterium gilvum PYR-GCK]ADU00972.1 hypothetical protein Mspyr1_44160 [Mycolicibacterium gilvum Spyr1]